MQIRSSFVKLLAVPCALAAASASGQTVIRGDEADFTPYKEVTMFGPDAIYATDLGDAWLHAQTESNAAFTQYNRPVFQFDISDLTEPIASARIELTVRRAQQNNFSPIPPFDVQLWGLLDPLEDAVDPASAVDPEGRALWDGLTFNGYERLDADDDLFAPRTVEDDETVSYDVTWFLQERQAEMLANPNLGWVVFQLRASDESSGAEFSFYAAEASLSDRPRLVVESEGTCDADRDGDGEATVSDLLDYLSDFRGGQGDIDGDGQTTVSDLLAFLSAFRAGC